MSFGPDEAGLFPSGRVIEIWGDECVSHSRLFPYEVLHLPGLGKYIFLPGFVLPSTGSGAVHESFGAQQGKDDIPHDGEVIAMGFVLENQDISVRDARETVDSEQALYRLMHSLQCVAAPLCSGFVKGKSYIHVVAPPVV